MYIKCWGSRGSIPISGPEFTIYGGDTTCIEIRSESDDIIIIDAGTGIRRLGTQLVKENRFNYHLIFTHAHWDHLMGFPFFKPIFMEQTEIIVYRCPFPEKYVESMIGKVMKPPNFPIKYSDLKARIRFRNGCPDSFMIGSMTIEPISISHPNSGCGYKFTENGKKFVILTDNELGYIHPNGHTFASYREFVRDADLLFHDAEYTPDDYLATKEWGHSVYLHALDLALQGNVRRLGLFHHNQERTDGEIDEMVRTCQDQIRSQHKDIDCFAVAADMTFTL
ncbi:MAG: MBL fold metallo-hydrolase [Deltaproteobacteria bacterium]|nr:MAG: MBL fold metallo-hydrolase [Deltaproteobacteria bacterium]